MKQPSVLERQVQCAELWLDKMQAISADDTLSTSQKYSLIKEYAIWYVASTDPEKIQNYCIKRAVPLPACFVRISEYCKKINEEVIS